MSRPYLIYNFERWGLIRYGIIFYNQLWIAIHTGFVKRFIPFMFKIFSNRNGFQKGKILPYRRSYLFLHTCHNLFSLYLHLLFIFLIFYMCFVLYCCITSLLFPFFVSSLMTSPLSYYVFLLFIYVHLFVPSFLFISFVIVVWSGLSSWFPLSWCRFIKI